MPGGQGAAGQDHIKNADKIAEIFGHLEYRHNAPLSGIDPDNSTPLALAAPCQPPTSQSAAERIHYPAPHSAELKEGGSLSDIIALEHRRGNPITLGELRAANGLIAGQDRR